MLASAHNVLILFNSKELELMLAQIAAFQTAALATLTKIAADVATIAAGAGTVASLGSDDLAALSQIQTALTTLQTNLDAIVAKETSPAAPVIVSFGVDVPTGPAGSPRVLTAVVTGSPAPTLTLSDGSANPPVPFTSPQNVAPAVSTTYTLTAVNATGTATSTPLAVAVA